MARVNIQQLLGLPDSSAAGLPPGSEPELAEGELPPVGLAAAGTVVAAGTGIAVGGSLAGGSFAAVPVEHPGQEELQQP